MGVIKRQGIKKSIVNYIGLGLGVINILIIYPLALGEEKLGLITFIISTASILVPFVLLGLDSVVIRFFPLFRSKDKRHNGFLTFIILWILIGIIFFLIFLFLFKDLIIQFYSEKSPEYLTYLPYTIPLVGFISFISILNNFSFNFRRVVVPAIFSQLIKIIQPALALAFFYGFISFTLVMDGIITYYLVSMLLLIWYIKYLGQWSLNFDFLKVKKGTYKEIFTFASFGVLGSLGSILATRIDGFMVASMTDLSKTGIYSVAIFMSTVIALPSEALISIASPIISDAWAKNDIKEIGEVYKKSSIILLTLGLLFLLGLWINIDSLFSLMPRGEVFSKGKYVVLILGIGKLIDMATSVNGHIIAFSKYFRFNFYSLLLLAVFNVVCNLLFIPYYDINGAAFATAMSLFLFNLVKFLFVLFKFKLSPFSLKSVQVLGITIFVYFLTDLIPYSNFPILDIILHSTALTGLFIPLILYFRISEDINNTFLQMVEKVQNYFTKGN